MAFDKIWISRNGSVYGPYKDCHLQKYCRDGFIKLSDLIWSSEKQEWSSFEHYLKSAPGNCIKPHNIRPDKIMSITAQEPSSSYEIPLSPSSFGTFIIHPIVCKDIEPNDEKFGSAIENLKMDPESGFICQSPNEHLNRGNLDRWLHKEPRALFRRDADEDIEEKYLKSPRIGWVKWLQNGYQKENQPTLPAWKTKSGISFQNCELGLLDTSQKRLRILDGMSLESFAMISKMGVILVVFRIWPKNVGKHGFSLGEAMNLNYHLANSSNFTNIPVIAPSEIFSKDVREAIKQSADHSFEMSDSQLEKCLKLWPHWEKKKQEPFDDSLKWGSKKEAKLLRLQSFFHLFQESVVAQLSREYGAKIETYQAARSRSHIFSNFLLPSDHGLAEDELDKIEGLCARCMRHPHTSNIKALPLNQLESSEFKRFHITGSQRVYLSCEGGWSFGIDETEFSKNWQDRWGRDYLLCHLIAYHQSILCQELSWSSFTKSSSANPGRTEEEIQRLKQLNARYIEFCTHYDFRIISNQINHQKIYRVSREVLGVIDCINEVSDEIESRLSHELLEEQRNLSQEQREFNKKQTSFNSLAVIFFLLGCSTFLINLNLTIFSEDAVIAWDFHGDNLGHKLSSLWFWVPVALTFSMLIFKSIRTHIFHVLKLLFKKESSL
jgi:hypothetical protein